VIDVASLDELIEALEIADPSGRPAIRLGAMVLATRPWSRMNQVRRVALLNV
jgi:hypothetical protein